MAKRRKYPYNTADDPTETPISALPGVAAQPVSSRPSSTQSPSLMGSLAPTIMQGVGRLAGFANQAEADLATRTARGISDIAPAVPSGVQDGIASAIVGGVGQGVPTIAGGARGIAEDAAPAITDAARSLAESAQSISAITPSPLSTTTRRSTSEPIATVEAAAPAPEQVVREPQISAIQSGQGDISDMANAARRDRIKSELGITDEQFDQIREQNLNDRRSFRRAKVQGMEQIKSLAQEVRAADQAGDTATAEALRNQILQIRQSIDNEGRRIGTIAQNLRGRISDLSPEEQTAASERTRAQLNAQLPTIAASARDQAKSAEQDQISRLADIGRRAYQLENGNLSDFAGMSDEAFAEYAQKQASPDAILRATRGVGLPPAAAPGAAGFADRVGSLSSIDFGRFSPSQPRSIDSQSLDAALQIAQEGGSNFNPLGGNAPATTEQAPASDFQSVVRQQQQQTGVPIDSEAVASIVSGSFAKSLREAAADNNTEAISSLASQLGIMAGDPTLSQDVRDSAVMELFNQISDLSLSGTPIRDAFEFAVLKSSGGAQRRLAESSIATAELRKALRKLSPKVYDQLSQNK